MQKNISPMKKFIVFDIGQNGALIDGVEYSKGRKYIKTDETVFVDGDIKNISYSNHYLANVINPDVKVSSVNKQADIITFDFNQKLKPNEDESALFLSESGFLNYLKSLEIVLKSADTQGATSGKITCYIFLLDTINSVEHAMLKMEAQYNEQLYYALNYLRSGSYESNNINDELAYNIISNILLTDNDFALKIRIENITDVTLDLTNLFYRGNMYHVKEGVY